MGKKKKKNKNNAWQPMSDANQHIRERNERIERHNQYIIRKIAEQRAKMELARQAETNNTAGSSISAEK